MADNVGITPGTGANIRTDDVGGIQYQVVKFDLGGDGVSQLPSVNSGTKDAGTLRVVLATDQPALSNALAVSDGGGAISVDDNGGSLTVDGTVSVSGAVDTELTTADLDTGAGTDTRAVVGLVIAKSGGAANISNTDPLPISDAGGNISIDDGGNSITVDGAVTVSGTVTANIGTSGSLALDASVTGLQVAQGSSTSGQKGALTLGAVQATAPTYTDTQTSPLSLTTTGQLRVQANLQQIAGNTVSTAASGIQKVGIADSAGASITVGQKVMASSVPVALASDQSALPVTDNSGSLTVDAPVGTPVFTTVTPSTTGGWSKIKYAAQTTTVQTPKGTAGTFGGYYIYNPNASVVYLQVFDAATATTITLGTTVPDMVFGIPATSAANLEITNGVNMANGIKLAVTTTATGSTAPSTGADMTVFYK